MIWAGDIYEQVSGEYRINTQYTVSGEFCVIRFGFDIIGYSNDTDDAKGKCETHAGAVR
jgi:hypothetical protein